MNKNIKTTSIQTYGGSNMENIEFQLNGLQYFAQRTWDKDNVTTDIIYGRIMENQYYDTIKTLEGGTDGMNNQAVSCIFGKMPEKLYEEIKKAYTM